MNTRLFKEMSTKWAKKHKKYQCRAETEHLPQPPQNYNRNSNKSQNEVFLKFLLQSAFMWQQNYVSKAAVHWSINTPSWETSVFHNIKEEEHCGCSPILLLLLTHVAMTWGISATTQEYRFLKFDADSLRSFSPGLWTPIREQTVWHFCW